MVKRKWWDKMGWQGLVLFSVSLLIALIGFLITGKYNSSNDFILGIFLGIFLAGEK